MRDCEQCGRPIASAGAKLCPACGYPVGRREAAAPEGVLRKPERETVAPAASQPPGTPRPTRLPPPPQVEHLGPYCPQCQHRSAPARIRCEHCGAELWPGAAAPRGYAPPPPETVPYEPPADRPWLTPVLFTAVTLAAIVVIYALTYTLA